MLGAMQNMMGWRGTVDCAAISEADLEQLGDQMMEAMIGDSALHERMEAQMGNATTLGMHLMMGRMGTGCWPR